MSGRGGVMVSVIVNGGGDDRSEQTAKTLAEVTFDDLT